MSEKSLLLFPYHLGPKVNIVTSSILYNGSLTVTLPGWPSGKPFLKLCAVLDYAKSINHCLLEPIRCVYYQFANMQVQTMNEVKRIEIFGDRVKKIMLVLPGTPEVYDKINHLNLSAEMKARLIESLYQEEYYSVAIIEMIFLINELMIILDDNPEKVLGYLVQRISVLGSFESLLAECLLNKITLSGNVIGGNFVTDSKLTIDILSDIGKESIEENVTEVAIDSLSFFLFDQVIRNGLGENGFNPKKINNIFKKHKDALESMKSKCNAEAMDLYFNCKNKLHIELKLKEVLKNINEEVNVISSLDAKSSIALYNKLTEDPLLWTSLAGVIGSIINGMSPTISASIAVTALSKIGTSALKVRRELNKRINDSPWSVIHYLR